MSTVTTAPGAAGDGGAAADPSDAELELAFSVQRNPGAYALLIGAGVSKEAGLPSAWDVQMELVREVASVSGEHPEDPAAWWTGRFGSEPRYDDLLERLGATPSERQGVLRRFFEPDPGDAGSNRPGPGVAHRALARLVASGRIRVVVTLNFDHLLETALRDEGITPTVVSTPAEFAALAPLHAQRAIVVHLHGDYVNPASMLNTADELGAYDPRAQALMAQVAAEYGLILVGWSATWDAALRDLIATNPNRHYTTWWIDVAPLSAPAERLRAMRGALVIRDGAASALGRLADAADAIDTTRARHPRSAQVAVASAKRALQGRTRAIALHDELRQEFALLARHPVVLEEAFEPPDVREEFGRRLAAYEEATGVLTALIATTAYWGSEETDLWWSGELPRLAEQEVRPGMAALLALRAYPATAILYAAGVGTVANGRFGVTADLLSGLTVIDQQGRYLGAAEVLAPDRTMLIPAASRRLFRTLRRSFVEYLGLGDRAYDEAWETFEYLLALERMFAKTDDRVIDDLRAGAERAWNEYEWSPAALTPGLRPAEAQLREQIEAVAPPDLALPHLRGGGWGDLYYPRVSGRLRRELIVREERHPFVAAGFCDGDLGALRVMVSVVDQVIARAAKDRADGAVFRDGLHARTTWLDELTPR